MKYFFPRVNKICPLYAFIEKYEIIDDEIIIYYANGEARTQEYSEGGVRSLERVMEYQVIDALNTTGKISDSQLSELKKYKFYLENKERLNENNLFINDLDGYTIDDLKDFKIVKFVMKK